MAEEIKKYMDKKFFGGWHVVCGRNFGLDVTHEEGSFLRATKGPLQFIIYRCSNWSNFIIHYSISFTINFNSDIDYVGLSYHSKGSSYF